MAEGTARRERILEMLRREEQPVSGSLLAARMGVSRQVIVQDIALLRVTDKNILSTNKGYILNREKKNSSKKKRTYRVKHRREEIQDELYTFVDLGGRVLDVVVEHGIYGQIMADLIINSRADAEAFVRKVNENKTKPLNDLTDGLHYHTVEADSEEILDRIGEALEKKGYLIK